MKIPFNAILAILASTSTTPAVFGAERSYPVVSTSQEKCYDNQSEIPAPAPGQPFYGQDAQFPNNPASYRLSDDGLTVVDEVTGLVWQRSPDTNGDGKITAEDKLTRDQLLAIPDQLNAAQFGGYNDWRLPSIKELYSLFDARGTDPDPTRTDLNSLVPYIDTAYFEFAYGDTNAGERIIDSQYASSTTFVGSSGRKTLLFGVNFADGRIKGYELTMPDGREKTFFVQCVRGNPDYGINAFHDNRDGTVSDLATGLMWSQADSGYGMDWEEALDWVENMNEQNYLGHNDWRMPNAKELQSLVDYNRSPESSESAAIDPIFDCTPITNEVGEVDFPFFWTNTTHAGTRSGDAAMYVAFGRAAGWMSPRNARGPGRGPSTGMTPDRDRLPPPPLANGSGEYVFLDVHGAGAQRSDPKSGNPGDYPHGRGPQGDVIHIDNYVRLVRNI